MKTKLLIILIILILVTVVYAADRKWSVFAVNTTVDDTDEMLLIDIGTGNSERITVLNLFDTIDTSAELIAILTDETGTGAAVFAIAPTLVTPALGVIASGVGTTLTALNGENIQDDTIDNDSIDWGDMTDLTTDGALDADVVDEAHIADNGIDSEHYNDGSIDLVHIAAAAYAVDLVTTAPVTGAIDNVMVGADADVTIALDFTAAWDFGGAAGSEWVNDGNPTTDAAGELALDTTIVDHQPLWQYYDGGENMTIIAIDTAQLPALDNEIIKYDAGTDKFILEADAGGGGNDVYVEEGDAARVDSSGADLYIDFDDTDFGVGVVGNEGNVTITDDGHAHTGASVTGIGDAQVDNNITIDLATLATTVTVTVDDATADNQEIVFTTDNANLESDTDFHYNPNTGTVTATQFVGGGIGGTTAWDDIVDPGADGSIAFGGYEQIITSTLDEANHIVFLIDHTDADVAANTTILQIQSVDNDDSSLTYFKVVDDSGTDVDTILKIVGGAPPTLSLGEDDNGVNLTINSAGSITMWDASNDNSIALVVTDDATRLRLYGDFVPYSDNNYDLGVSGTEWKDGFFDGTLEADIITEGGNAVPNATDNLGFFGGTSSAELYGELSDETGSAAGTPLAVFNTAPVFVTSIQLTGADANPAAAAGTIVYDSTIAGMSGGGLRWYDNNSVRMIVDLETDPSNDDYVVAYDSTADGFYMKVDDDTGGSTKWNAIGDADGVGSIDFVTYTQTIDIGVTDTGGPKDGLILTATGLGAGTTDVRVLKITTTANNDTDYIPLSIYDNSGGTPDLLYKVDSNGRIYPLGGVELSAGTTLTGGVTSITLTSGGSTLMFDTSGSGVDLIWSDGVLNLRNDEDGVDAIVEIEGKDGGEKGILRVLSDGDDKYIEFYHDDTDAHIISSSGDIHIEAVGGDINFADDNITTTGTIEGATLTEGGVAVINATQGGTWTGTHDFGGADLEIPQATPAVPGVDGGVELDFTDGKLVIQHGSAHTELGASTDVVMGSLIQSWSGTIFEPDGINDVMTVKAINSIEFPHGVVITAIYLGVSENSNYTLTFQNFDDFDTINGAQPTIDVVAYTADASGEIIDTSPTYATIAAGQIIMISIPATNVDWINFCIYYFEPAA